MIDIPPPDPADVVAMALWEDVQGARLLYELHQTDQNLAHLRAHLDAFTQAFTGWVVLQ